MKGNKQQKYSKSINKELSVVRREEELLKKQKMSEKSMRWKYTLISKVPDNVYGNLTMAFTKAFSLIFDKGLATIEKTFNQEELAEDYKIKEYAFLTKADRKSLNNIKTGAGKNNIKNMAFTTVEGIGLGAFGIGLPDIVLFVGVLLRGIYETALHYGFGYESEEEQYFILKMIEVSMIKGEAWVNGNDEVDEMLVQGLKTYRMPSDIKTQINRTSTVFAVDMIVLKFIQGIPVVGMIGGAGNPVYYNKVMKYAELKYRKRRLLQLSNEIPEQTGI